MNYTKATKIKEVQRAWHIVDVKDQILGRVATRIAKLLMGKGKPYFVKNLDCGDYVVVENAQQIRVTGKKASQKLYMRYSGYPGGLKKKPFEEVLKTNPTRIIREAVSGMLPQNKLRASFLKKLYIFPDDNHQYKNKVTESKTKSS